MPAVSVDELARGVVSGERRAVAKAITLVESTRRDHQELAERLVQTLLPRTGRATRVAVSGAPGVGKSTFIEALGLLLVGEGRKLAVLAVDPSSTVSGGSILGDKTRMPRLAVSPQAFIRPSPTGGTLGGVTRRTRETMLICEAAGFDVVFVETVGVGQSELAVADMVDVFLLLLIAGAGDELQGIKRGIMEIADVLCINKADGDGVERAARAAAEMHAALGLLHPDAPPRVLSASALEGRGIREVWTALSDHRTRLERDGSLELRRARQDRQWFWSLLRDGLQAAFVSRPDVARELGEIERQLDARAITPTAAVRRLLSKLDDGGA